MKKMPAVGDAAALAVSAAAGLLLTFLLLSPTGSDVRDLAIYLAAGGIASFAATELLVRSRIVSAVLSLRQKMVVASVFVIAIAFFNTFLLSALMFVSSDHDLPMLVAILAFAGGISVYVAIRLASRYTQALDVLSTAVSRLGGGDLSVRVPVVSQDEFGTVSRSFNGMADSLEQAVERQRQLEESRKEMTAAIAHDLRTPLASARALLEAINDDVVDDPGEQREYVHRSLGQINDLTELVNDLFELSLIDAGALKLDRRQTPLQQLVLETVEGFSAAAAKKRLEISADVEDATCEAVIDGLRVRRVLVNLLQNAIKHTPPDGTVTVSARDDGNEVRIDVVDSGSGISDEEMPKIWDRFYKVDESRTRAAGEPPGSGLGLAIARGIVLLHGGWIDVAPGNGGGARFSIGLPKSVGQGEAIGGSVATA